MTGTRGGFWQSYGWQLLTGGAISLLNAVAAWSMGAPDSLAKGLVWWPGILGMLATAMVINEWGFGKTVSILLGLCVNALVWAFILIIVSRIVSRFRKRHARADHAA